MDLRRRRAPSLERGLRQGTGLGLDPFPYSY